MTQIARKIHTFLAIMRIPDSMRAKHDEKVQRVAELSQLLAVAQADLRGWEEAIRLITSPIGSYQLRQSTNGETATPKLSEVRLRDGRGVSGNWRNIFAETATVYPNSVSLNDILAMAERLGTPVARNNLRSQVSTYSDKGILERVGSGAYRLTPDGAKQLGASLPETTAPHLREQESEAASPFQEDAALE